MNPSIVPFSDEVATLMIHAVGVLSPFEKSRCYSVDKTIAYLLIWEIDLKCIKSFVEIFYCQITAQIYNKQLLLHVGLVVDKL